MYDTAVRYLVPPATTNDQIVIVEVDHQTMRDLGERWPFPRTLMAKFVRQLRQLGPRVIALDMVFDTPSSTTYLDALEEIRESIITDGVAPKAESVALIDDYSEKFNHDKQLASAIANAGNVILGEIILASGEAPIISPTLGVSVAHPGERIVKNTPLIGESIKAGGVLNVNRAFDGVIRRYTYLWNIDGVSLPSLALSTLQNAYPERAEEFWERAQALDDGSPLMRFPQRQARLHFSDILESKQDPRTTSLLRDRIVIVGATAAGLHDQHATPIHLVVPGVELHAAAMANLLEDDHFQSKGMPAWFGLAITVLFLVLIMVGTERVSLTVLFAALPGVVLLHLGLMYVLLMTLGWLIAFIPVAGGALALIGIEALVRVRELRQQRRHVEEQERLNIAKSDFMATVSHELRTPLTSIRGSLGLIAGGVVGKLPDQASELVNIAHSNTERLIRLVNNFLDFQKIATGRMEFHLAPVELLPILNTTVTENQSFAEQFGVTVSLESDPGIWVNADADLFTQAVTNLLSNAIKFSSRGESVDVRTDIRANMVRISVIDRGPGIPEEFRSRIFTKFAQAGDATSSGTKGSGLGLNIVKLIVEEHEGNVGFDTELGKGSTFYIDIASIAPPAEHTESSE